MAPLNLIIGLAPLAVVSGLSFRWQETVLTCNTCFNHNRLIFYQMIATYYIFLSCVYSPQVAQDNLAMAWARSVCMNDSKAAAAVGVAQRAGRTTAATPPGESRGWWRCCCWRWEGTCQRNRCILVIALLWQVEVATYFIRQNVNNGYVWLHHLPSKVPRAIHACTLAVACHNCLPLQLAQLQCSGGLSLSLGRFPLSVYVFLEERRVHV